MTQPDLERILRSTLNSHADTVSHGPAWSGAGAAPDIALAPRGRRRWLAPLAAVAVVLTVVAGAIALRHDDPSTDSKPVATAQVPVPNGMKAVDALGVEIFVPQEFRVDALCSGPKVTRPVAIRAPSCPLSTGSTVVSISPDAHAQTPSGRCMETLVLGGESTCLIAHAVFIYPAQYSATWPRHGVALTAGSNDQALVLSIFRSAHEVSIDRHGCAAARDPIDAPGQHDPADIGGAPAVPADRPAKLMDVCWYIAQRLVASATLDAKDAATVLHGAATARPLFSPVSEPACLAVDHRDAVILSVRYARGGAAEGIMRLAGCPGRDAGTPSDFVATLAQLTGMPLALGYPAQR